MTAGPACCACPATSTTVVLDLGQVPAADVFPPAGSPVNEPRHDLAMALCPACGLAQIVRDDTTADEPRGVEPQALLDQAAAAVEVAAACGWLTGSTVREFPSPHGGTWVPMVVDRGLTETTGPADVVLDSFGLMHDADQRVAWRARADATSPDGVLLLQFHSLAAIVGHGLWTALRHGHAAYFSLTSVVRLASAAGMTVVGVAEFELYGGTVLAALRPGRHEMDPSVHELLRWEDGFGATDVDTVSGLQRTVTADTQVLRAWLAARRADGLTVYAYGAASRAVALFSLAGLDASLVVGVADASPAKQGRRMPGTDVPIVSPPEMVAARPDLVLVTLPDLLPELEAAWPELRGRWVVTVGTD